MAFSSYFEENVELRAELAAAKEQLVTLRHDVSDQADNISRYLLEASALRLQLAAARERLATAEADSRRLDERLAELKWLPLDAIHEEGMPYVVWDIYDPADMALVTCIDELPLEGWTHCMSLKPFFMEGYQMDIDDAIDAAGGQG